MLSSKQPTTNHLQDHFSPPENFPTSPLGFLSGARFNENTSINKQREKERERVSQVVERYNRYTTHVNSLQGSEQFAAVFLLEVKRVIDGENVASLYNVFIFTNLIQKCSNCCIYLL